MSLVDMDLVITALPTDQNSRDFMTRLYRSQAVETLDTLEEARSWRLNEDWRPFVPSPFGDSRQIIELADAPREKWQPNPLWLPDRDADGWGRTHPLAQIQWTAAKNRANDGNYVDIVRAIKWWRQTNSDSLPKYPKGYPLEHMIGHVLQDGTTSMAQGVVQVFESMRDNWALLAAASMKPRLSDHGVPEHDVLKRLDVDDFKAFHAAAASAAETAREALLSQDAQESAGLWRDLFGSRFPRRRQFQAPPVDSPDHSVTPPVLQSIAEQIRDEARIRVEGDWEIDEKGRWHLAIVTHLSVAPSQHMPGETKWRVVIGPNQPADGVFIYPDAVGGIATTFRHQDYNPEPEPGAMWRDGKPCLERPIDGLGRDQWEDEPRELAAAALWKTGRLLQWIDAAAADALVEEGAANELPAGVGIGSKLTLGFREVFEGLDWAASVRERWGFASIASVPGATKTWALTELLDDRSNSIRRFEWGTSLAAAPSSIGAVWLLVPVLPVREPWDAPKTWAQLRDVLLAHNVDLVDIMAKRHLGCIGSP
ncbi:hypothetical protein LTR94_025579 [Friedmanniomyces endolithicus]|nr:hypothetical protein LTR94_025579 [Friedmanniomyces endolithicus]